MAIRWRLRKIIETDVLSPAKGWIMSEDIGGFLPLPKNIPKNCLKLSYPVQGNDKILVRFNRLVVKNITVQK